MVLGIVLGLGLGFRDSVRVGILGIVIGYRFMFKDSVSVRVRVNVRV